MTEDLLIDELVQQAIRRGQEKLISEGVIRGGQEGPVSEGATRGGQEGPVSEGATRSGQEGPVSEGAIRGGQEGPVSEGATRSGQEGPVSEGAIRCGQEGGRKRVVWPISEEFTVEKGQLAIEKTVQEWRLSESWKHCIDYLGTRPDGRLGREGGGEGGEGKSGEKGGLHCYRVKWSEPTRRKPVPIATASTYFFLQQHRNKSPVQACFVLEGQRLVHRPGSTIFKEIWLRNIIQQKLSIVNTNPQWSPIRTD